MNTKTAIVCISVGTLVCMCSTFLVHACITRPPKPCGDVIHKFGGYEDHSACPVGSSAHVVFDDIVICRCKGARDVETPAP